MALNRLALDAGLFRGLSAAEIDALMLRLNGVRKTYRKGETVVHAGLKANRLMLVVAGHLHVYEQMSDDRPVLVREIGAGEVLGLWILHVPEIGCWPGIRSRLNGTVTSPVLPLSLLSSERKILTRASIVWASITASLRHVVKSSRESSCAALTDNCTVTWGRFVF